MSWLFQIMQIADLCLQGIGGLGEHKAQNVGEDTRVAPTASWPQLQLANATHTTHAYTVGNNSSGVSIFFGCTGWIVPVFGCSSVSWSKFALSNPVVSVLVILFHFYYMIVFNIMLVYEVLRGIKGRESTANLQVNLHISFFVFRRGSTYNVH